MRFKVTCLPFIALSISALPCVAQGVGRDCSIDGTWYGGNDAAKYLLTVTHTRGGEYQITFHPGFKPRVPALAAYSGVLVFKGRDTFVGQAIALANQIADPPSEPGAPASYPEIWAVRFQGRMTDCTTIEYDIDFFGVYTWQNGKMPFYDAPDTDRLAGRPSIREVYKRMPADCPRCPMLISAVLRGR